MKKYKNLFQEQDNQEIQKKLYDFLVENPSPKDSEIHAFAESLNIEPDEIEEIIYGMLGSLIGGGFSKGKEFDYDPKEMEMGMKVEAEHTDNPLLVHKIVLDHLKEHSDYYTKLTSLEL